MHAKIRSIFAITALICAMPLVWAQTNAIQLDLPAQSLAKSLRAVATAANTNVLFDTAKISSRTAPALKGKVTIDEALQRLLVGSGLKFRYLDDKTIVLAAEEAATSDASIPAEQMRVAENTDSRKSSSRSESSSEEDKKNQVTVTDSRIKPYSDANVDIPRTKDDAQPYYFFDSETIERSGVANIEDFLKQRLTMNASAGTLSQYGTGGGSQLMGQGNVSRINLRGLGTDKTLILVNGRRRAGVFSGDEGLQQTDLNGIPLSAVDRIEVLPTSASGIYGGSAIGGVINVILKKNYTGGDLWVNYDSPMDNAAPRRTVAGLYGFALEGGRTNLTLSGSWSDSGAMVLRDRRETYKKHLATILQNNPALIYPDDGILRPRLGATLNIVGRDSSGQPTNLILDTNSESLGTPYTHLDPGISPTTSRSDLEAALRRNAGAYNLELAPTAQQFGLLQPLGLDTQVRSLQVTADRKMLSWLDAYAEVSWSENSGQGTQVDSGFSSIFVPATWAINPFAVTIMIALPMAPDGNKDHDRNVRTEYVSRQAVLGLQARLPYNWTGQLDYQWSENEQSSVYHNVDIRGILLGMRDSLITQFVDTIRYPLNIDNLWFPTAYRGKNSLSTLSLRGSGGLVTLPWGAARLTVGLEHRSARTPAQTYSFMPPLSTFSNNETYYYPKHQTADNLYAEVDLPLVAPSRYPMLHSLSVQIAGRADRYEVDAGTFAVSYLGTSGAPSYSGTTINDQPYFTREKYESNNQTFGLKYEPVAWLTLRTSMATAFLPVMPSQLQRNPIAGQDTVNDPVNGSTPDVAILRGGNPDLKPQNSRSFNAGLILQPQISRLKGLRLNLEYYSVKQFNAIGGFSSYDQLLSQESVFPDRVVRDSSGMVTQLDMSAVNLYRRDTAGLDVSLGYDFTTAAGHFNLQATESMVHRLKTQYAQSEPAYDAAGFHPSEGGALDHKRSTTLTWDVKSWSVGWAMTYFSSYKQIGAAGGPISVQGYGGEEATPYPYIRAQGSDTIASQDYHDLSVNYTFASDGSSSLARALGGMNVSAGVRNIFNKEPPFDASYESFFYTSGYGDLRLRSYWLGLKRAFGK